MSNIDLQIPERHFTCSNCGRCCRDWHVELVPADVERLASLRWTAGDPKPEEYLDRVQNRQVLAHHDDGTCIFYDPNRKGCVIHHRFGYDAKPVGCRLYPFQLATTFANTVSATIRFECPAVHLNTGKPLSKRAAEFRKIAKERGLPGIGFDSLDLGGLQPEKCREIVQALRSRVICNTTLSGVDRLIIAQRAVTRLETLGTTFINEIDMSDIFPSFFERLLENHKQSHPRRLGALEQARFLSVFCSFLRRDEEQLSQGFRGRLNRTLALLKLLNGKVNPRDLSKVHPDVAMSRADFFSIPIDNVNDVDLSIIFELLHHRLESYQFFGAPVYNRSFYFGLRTLFMLGGLILAWAKWQAIERQGTIAACQLTADDVADATSAIHHPYGRSVLLGAGFMNTLQRQICQPDAFERIVTEIAKGTP